MSAALTLSISLLEIAKALSGVTEAFFIAFWALHFSYFSRDRPICFHFSRAEW